MAEILGCTSERVEPFVYSLAPLERFRIVGYSSLIGIREGLLVTQILK